MMGASACGSEDPIQRLQNITIFLTVSGYDRASNLLHPSTGYRNY